MSNDYFIQNNKKKIVFFVSCFCRCNKEYVEVRDGATKNSPLLGRYCNSKPSSISSTDNVLFVNFLTDVDDPRNGFKAKISIGKCYFLMD